MLVFILIVLLSAGTVYPRGYEAKKRVSDDEAEVKTDTSLPIIGDNNIEIEIKDGGGKQIKRGSLSLSGVEKIYIW